MRIAVAAGFAFISAMGAVTHARADCAAEINLALPIARGLPDPKGRGAVLENIERARASRHDGDEDACHEQMQEVLALLCPPKTAAGGKDSKSGASRPNPACRQ
ncbi:MAG: hypothetical protein WDN04_10145 [Rhodospirillales bacterium]